MDNCEKYRKISIHYLGMIESILNSESELIENWIIEDCMEYDNALTNRKINPPCMDCANCLDFSYYKKILYEFLQSEESKNDLEIKLHSWKKVIINDKLISNYKEQTDPYKFARKSFSINNNDVYIYLDTNIYNNFISKDNSFKCSIKTSKDNIHVHYMYSPSHLEELLRMKINTHQESLLTMIREITSDLIVSRFDGKKLSLAFENPEYGLARIKGDEFITEEYENYKLLLADDRRLFYPEHTSQEYNRELTVKKILENEHFKLLCSRYQGMEWLDWKNDYSSLNNAVNSFCELFDNLSFKRNKNNRTIKSNTHDIEHVIYAVMANFFVTDDGNLRERASLIYESLGIDTKVLSPVELLEKLGEYH
ncbi:hypothetical protein C173_03234 [Paenibacillus sp. FSL R7-277]|uniref:hypothetical protein n=1 Tax=Paenibacillus sp. FSL R7-277 TaxID=1227352 RepID=UPI0003E21F93|nr:hypothetical protein [Paenibacillus sp. FSL R7-277]ETT77496.1 hypothetical protein C173_03234 [Paenibacillus sp. FSL R7-277]